MDTLYHRNGKADQNHSNIFVWKITVLALKTLPTIVEYILYVLTWPGVYGFLKNPTNLGMEFAKMQLSSWIFTDSRQYSKLCLRIQLT